MLPRKDLDRISDYYKHFDLDLESKSFLISGATGFVGSWILESLLHLNREFNLGIAVTGITRNTKRAKEIISSHEDPSLNFITEDIRFLKTINGNFTHIVHAATPTTALARDGDIENLFESSVIGAQNLIKIAESQANPPVFLHTSSGAVYGRQSLSLEVIPLTSPRQEFSKSSIIQDEYARAKVETEKLIEFGNLSGSIFGINARLFAFMGPRLPLNEHYAIGNFLYSGIYENEIKVFGDGQTVRSYQHASDMTSQLIYLLGTGNPGNFHIGSDIGKKIIEWANLVGIECKKPVIILNSDLTPASRYIPEHDSRIPRGLGEDISMSEHIACWRDWISQ